MADYTGEAVERIKRRLTALQSERSTHEADWSDCYRVTFPERASGLAGGPLVPQASTQAEQIRLYDSTAGDACNTGAATVMGSMIPASSQWFGLDIGEHASDEERTFLDGAAKFVWENLHASNFDSEAMDCMLDTWCTGWFVLYVDEDEDGGFYTEQWPLGQCFVAASKLGGLVDTIYRQHRPTVAQLVAEYGLDRVSEGTREKHRDGKLDERVDVVHCIEPRSVYDPQAKLGRNMRFASFHVELQACHMLREGGYHEFPCAVPRWSRLPGSVYAIGPMARALADVRTLNEVVRLGLLGAETAIAPPMIAEDDGVLNPKNIRLGPRRIIVANSVDSIKPLIDGAKPEYADVKVAALQAGVRRILMADHLPPAETPAKTAYEWSVRVETLRKMLGPMFGRFQAEFLRPIVERCFGIVWRANAASGGALIGKPPESLVSRWYLVRYMSPLARAQRMEEVAAMDRYELALAQEAAIDPSVLDVYDLDAAARERGHLLGVPHKLMRDERAVVKRRLERAEAQKQAQAQAMAANGQAEMQGAMAQRMANAA